MVGNNNKTKRKSTLGQKFLPICTEHIRTSVSIFTVFGDRSVMTKNFGDRKTTESITEHISKIRIFFR